MIAGKPMAMEIDDKAEGPKAGGLTIEDPKVEIRKVEDPKVSCVTHESHDGIPERKLKGAWSSRWSFILACIGSAIGLGNFWRFPMLVFRHGGGGAFFIPYVISTIVLGVPLMQLEMALGQVMRKAATQSFGSLDPRWRGIGVGAALVSSAIVTLYVAILGWSNVMFVASFFQHMPWSIDGLSGADVITVPSDYFYDDLLQMSYDRYSSRIISSAPFAGSLFMWAMVWFVLTMGQAFISKAVWVTVLLPVATMLVLVVVGATLPGASIGINAYLGIGGDLSALSSGAVWYDAVSQTFFSLSLATGVLPYFASMNPSHQNVLQDAVIVATCNALFSFLSGFAVFAIIGYMSEESGIAIADLNEQGLLGGPSLAFVAYPAGLSLVGGAGANALCVLFFATFFFLGVDSAFSLVESVVANLRETRVLGRSSRAEAVNIVCGMGFLWTVLYCSDLGLYLVDVVDRFGSTLGLNFVGFAEAFVCGWLYNRANTVSLVGSTAALVFDVGFWVGFFLFTVLALGLPHTELQQSSVLAIAFGVGVPVAFGSAAAAVFLGSRPGTNNSAGAALRALTLDGPHSLAVMLNETITDGAPSNWKFRPAWSLGLKFLMSPALFFLLAMQVQELSSAGGYADYPVWMNSFGAVVFAVIAAALAFGFVQPTLYEEVAAKP